MEKEQHSEPPLIQLPKESIGLKSRNLTVTDKVNQMLKDLRDDMLETSKGIKVINKHGN